MANPIPFKRSPLDTHHALSIGGAGHALKGGHINKAQHDHIVKSARKALGKGKGKPMAMFGSLAPDTDKDSE